MKRDELNFNVIFNILIAAFDAKLYVNGVKMIETVSHVDVDKLLRKKDEK